MSRVIFGVRTLNYGVRGCACAFRRIPQGKSEEPPPVREEKRRRKSETTLSACPGAVHRRLPSTIGHLSQVRPESGLDPFRRQIHTWDLITSILMQRPRPPPPPNPFRTFLGCGRIVSQCPIPAPKMPLALLNKFCPPLIHAGKIGFINELILQLI